MAKSIRLPRKCFIVVVLVASLLSLLWLVVFENTFAGYFLALDTNAPELPMNKNDHAALVKPQAGLDCGCPKTCNDAALSIIRKSKHSCGDRIRHLMSKYHTTQHDSCSLASRESFTTCGAECDPDRCEEPKNMPSVAVPRKQQKMKPAYLSPSVTIGEAAEKMIIVTGASENYGDVLAEFLQEHRFLQETPFPLVVVDLGLSETRRRALENDPQNRWIAEWHTFKFSQYPPHVDINTRAGEYAWKPLSIWHISVSHNSTGVMWFDAGVRIAGPQVVQDIVTHISKVGYFTVQSEGTVTKWVHPGTQNWIFDNEERCKAVLHLPMASGGFAGFNILTAGAILREFVDCALVKECIAPNGSSRQNHRQDQAVLTLLLYKHYGPTLRFPLPVAPIQDGDVLVNSGLSIQSSSNEPQNIMREKHRQRERKKREKTLAYAVNQSTVLFKSQAQVHPLPEASMLSVLASKVDRVYICCVRCLDINWIHPTWAKSVTLVDGKLFDKYDPDLKRKPLHNAKDGKKRKTRMHRAIIAHAKTRHNAATTMILEEDVIVSPSAKNGSIEWADKVLNIDGWSLIRLDHMWFPANDGRNKVVGCSADCKCVQAMVGTVPVDGACVLSPDERAVSELQDDSWYRQMLENRSGFCDLRSTAAYIVSSRTYEHFLHHSSLGRPWHHVIDLAPVNTVPVQVILHPMPALQDEKKAVQMKTSKEFESKCVEPSDLGGFGSSFKNRIQSSKERNSLEQTETRVRGHIVIALGVCVSKKAQVDTQRKEMKGAHHRHGNKPYDVAAALATRLWIQQVPSLKVIVALSHTGNESQEQKNELERVSRMIRNAGGIPHPLSTQHFGKDAETACVRVAQMGRIFLHEDSSLVQDADFIISSDADYFPINATAMIAPIEAKNERRQLYRAWISQFRHAMDTGESFPMALLGMSTSDWRMAAKMSGDLTLDKAVQRSLKQKHISAWGYDQYIVSAMILNSGLCQIPYNHSLVHELGPKHLDLLTRMPERFVNDSLTCLKGASWHDNFESHNAYCLAPPVQVQPDCVFFHMKPTVDQKTLEAAYDEAARLYPNHIRSQDILSSNSTIR